jgi:hypothetical protein
LARDAISCWDDCIGASGMHMLIQHEVLKCWFTLITIFFLCASQLFGQGLPSLQGFSSMQKGFLVDILRYFCTSKATSFAASQAACSNLCAFWHCC